MLEILSRYIGYIVGIVTGLVAIWKWVAKPVKDWLKKLDGRLAAMQQMDEEQNKKLDLLDLDMADTLCSQLTQEHDRAVQRGWCPTTEKERIGKIYERYKQRGRNHISDHLMDDILRLPSEGV